MLRRSPGACGPTISGPSEIISTPASLVPITAHSRPPWTISRLGSLPNSARTSCVGREERRVEVRLPGRVRAPELDLRAGEARGRLDRRDDVLERQGVRAPRHRRERDDAVGGARDVEARARLDRAGRFGFIATTRSGWLPRGRAHVHSSPRLRQALVRRARSRSASPSSVPANCSRIAAASRSAASRNSSSARTATTARASRGSAFRLTPPSSRASRSGRSRGARAPGL